LEDRLTRRMADSVESLGEIIHEYANKYQELNEKVKALQAKGPVIKTSKVPTKFLAY